MKEVNDDCRVEELYNWMLNIFDISRVFRVEFEKVLVENRYSPYFI